MSILRVVITDYIEPDLEWETEQFSQLDVDFSFFQLKNATAPELLCVIEDADVIIVNMAHINKEVIQGLKRAKLIIRHGVGYDNIDVEAASQHGIVVSYMPDYCMYEVAEQAVMLILACQRKLSVQVQLTAQSSQQGKWVFKPVYPIYSLRNKTLGIVGFGRIGSIVRQMMAGFELKQILVCDPYLSEGRRIQLGYEYVPLEQLLRESDIVTIHTPLNSETYHLLDEEQFRLMKPTAILINTARGGIVNLDALDKALNAGQLMFAGIDVYEVEPPAKELTILKNEKAICTPHLAWLSEEAGWNIREKIVDDVRRFLNGEGPRYPINKGVQIQFER
jgi:D-3-phosphoglycerate dehydrogenase